MLPICRKPFLVHLLCVRRAESMWHLPRRTDIASCLYFLSFLYWSTGGSVNSV
uniref:Uncharacterized protein n=1 Tax=Arundo donax TaxID=35708 RepID=A0A0A9CJ02_ARUDO